MVRRNAKKPEPGNKQDRDQQPPKLKELVDKITLKNRYAETSVGSERGKERVEW
jgi:hypothetical protein